MSAYQPGGQDAAWQDQWRRMHRWMARLRAASSGTLSYIGQAWCDPALGFDMYKDDVLAFFEACFHLKDWLRKDPLSREQTSDVEEFIKNNEWLRIAADVANRSKHALADRMPRVDANAQPRSHRSVVYGSDGQFEMVGGEVILVGGEFLDAMEIAERCIGAWEDYLIARGLLVRPAEQ